MKKIGTITLNEIAFLSDPCYDMGVWSSSGCGDGQYPVYCEFEGDKAYAIRIKYL